MRAQAVCEAQETLKRLSRQIPFGVLKLASASSKTCCQLAAEHIGLPLGMMPDVAYQDWELILQAGDIVIFYTDGIIEAENEAEEMYGTERLEKALSGIDSAMSSSDIIDAILKDVTDFTGSAEQYDDMTIVVIKKL